MTDTWFIFNNQGNLTFNTENPLYATTDYLPIADRPGYIVKNPVGYDITKTISYDINTNEVVIGDFSLDISPSEKEPFDVVSIVSDVKALTNQISTINTKLTSLENISNSNILLITNIENTINMMQSQITTINTQVQGVESTLSSTLVEATLSSILL
jgi:hypothetical protein